MDGEEGAFPVFEAVLVAILILGAIVFVSLTASPSQEEGAGGISMGRVASDTLAILQVREAQDPAEYGSALEEIIAMALDGQSQDAEAYLREVLPRGTNFEMRLDNGVAPLGLLPYGRTASLRAADGDAVLMVAPWPSDYGGAAPDDSYIVPGGRLPGDLNLDECTSLAGPAGSVSGPGQDVTWLDLWLADQDDPNEWRVPHWAPYGWWLTSGGCGDVAFRVVHPACPATSHEDAEGRPVCLVERPVYGVQLLVWDGV